jgi:hypothetical protein
MKAIEILSENKQIAEGPASMLGQAAKRIGAAALGAAGLKTWAGQLDSKADVGQFANRYYKEYQRYLRTAGRPESEATIGDLKDFMLKNGIPTQNVPPNTTGSADKDSVFAILNKTAQEYIKGSGGASGSVGATAGAGGNTAAQTTPQSTQPNQAQTATPGAQAPNTQQASNQPFSIPALLQVIPQMRKKDLNKIISAAQTALQNPAAASKNAATATAPVNTSNMTPAQIRATKQAQAANAAQAQMKANPVPAPAAAPQTPAQIRAEKQKAAAANAQAQMANPKPAAAPAPQSSVKVSAPRRGRRKVAVAV